MAAHLAQGFSFLDTLRQLMKDKNPKNQFAISATCRSLDIFITAEVKHLETAQASVECAEYQVRADRLSLCFNKHRASFLRIESDYDTHTSYVASLSRRILALSQGDSQSHIGSDECRQFECFYLTHQLSIATTDLLAMGKKHLQAKDKLQQIEAKLKRLENVYKEQVVALKRRCEEWRTLAVEGKAVLAEAALWWKDVTGVTIPL